MCLFSALPTFETLHISMNLFLLWRMSLLGLMHPHHRSHLYCSSCFGSFCFSIGLGGVGNLIKKKHYLVLFNLFLGFFLLVGFCIHSNGIRVLGIPFGFTSFFFFFFILYRRGLKRGCASCECTPKVRKYFSEFWDLF